MDYRVYQGYKQNPNSLFGSCFLYPAVPWRTLTEPLFGQLESVCTVKGTASSNLALSATSPSRPLEGFCLTDVCAAP
jgi:hypothetical protein